jgi:hypothetical protein
MLTPFSLTAEDVPWCVIWIISSLVVLSYFSLFLFCFFFVTTMGL